MKAIFLCNNQDYMFKVFSGETLEKIQELTQIEKVIYSKNDIMNNPSSFTDTEFIFSTWGMEKFTEEEIKEYLPNLKCIFYGAGTVQTFARPFLDCGVKIFSAWAANAVPVAEFTVAQIILSNKGYYLTNRMYKTNDYTTARDIAASCGGNYGETVGIIGAGMIGKLVINMLKAFNLKVIVFDPFLPDEKALELGVEKCSLTELFERSFVVSNHLANNEQTKGMLSYDLFSRMRKNAVFINTGRGAQVVEDDLVRILSERPDLTALLDVTDPEPSPKEHPFHTLPNCFLTPHIAGSLGEEVARMGEYMLLELTAYLNDEPCKYEVNQKMLETMA